MSGSGSRIRSTSARASSRRATPPEAETDLHRTVYAEFKAQLATRQSALRAEGGLMALDGTIEMFD